MPSCPGQLHCKERSGKRGRSSDTQENLVSRGVAARREGGSWSYSSLAFSEDEKQCFFSANEKVGL